MSKRTAWNRWMPGAGDGADDQAEARPADTVVSLHPRAAEPQRDARANRRTDAALAMAGAALVAALAALLMPVLAPSPDERLATVEATAADARRTLDAVQADAEAAQARAGALAAALDERLAVAEQRLERVAGPAAEAVRLALATQLLAARLETNRPFRRELDALKRIGHDLSLASLAPYADRGVATRPELRETFTLLVAQRILAAADAPAAPTLAQRVQGWVTQTVTGGDTPATLAARRLAAVERRMAEGDLAGALADLTGMGQPAVVIAARWIEEARARLAVEAAADALLGAALDGIERM